MKLENLDATLIFGEALRLIVPAERAAYLDQACAEDLVLRHEVESLLIAYEQAGDFLGHTIPLPAPDFLIERTGTMIGRYKLLERIGEGGFGVVYMAEQVEPVQRKVALKIIKAGMDTREVIARFEAERQALALMDHPNISKALEKERGRRYESASALARDIERHLGSEPVSAAAPGSVYRARKFVRRHRAALAIVCAFVVVLAAGTGISVWQAVRASQQARFADARRLEADTSRQEAGAAQTRADRAAQEASWLLTRQYEREGTRLLNERDLTGSLVYFAEVLQREEGDRERARLHRLRIALVLGQCPELRGLLVQAGNVVTARFTTDGNAIISAAKISECVTQVRVWEAAGLKPLAERDVEAECERVVLSPNGSWIATYDQVGFTRNANAIGLWDVRQPKAGLVLSTNSGMFGKPAVFGFSRDDHRAVLAIGGEVRVWDTARGQPIGGALSLTNEVIYAALSADGAKLALCVSGAALDSAAKGKVLLLNAETLEFIASPLIHDGWPLFAGFDATGQRLITTSVCAKHGLSQGEFHGWYFTTGEARVWDVRSGQPLTPPLRHDQPVYQAELSPDGLTLVTVTGNPIRLLEEGVGEGQMHFWNVSGKTSPERSYQTLPLAGLVTAKFATDGQSVLVGRDYEILEPWWNWAGIHPPDIEGFSIALPGPKSGAFGLKFPYSDFFVNFSPDGHRCLVSNKGRTLQVWQLRTSGPWTNKPLPGAAMEVIRSSPAKPVRTSMSAHSTRSLTGQTVSCSRFGPVTVSGLRMAGQGWN